MEAFEIDWIDDGWDPEDDPGIGLEEAAWVSCPYCGEAVELLLDPGGGSHQEYIEDCEICCRPWSVRVAVDGAGRPDVSVTTLDEE